MHMPLSAPLMRMGRLKRRTFYVHWDTRLCVCVILLAAITSKPLVTLCTASDCSWTTDPTNRLPLLNNCCVLYNGSDVGAIENTPSNPASWIPASIRPPGPWPQPSVFRGLTLALPSCAPVLLISELACTFRLSSAWPPPGLQAGRTFLLFGHLVSSSVVFERLNVTCPDEDWDSLFWASSAAPRVTPRLAPCGTATVSTGEQLVDVLQKLQLTHERVILTLADNIAIPADPTPQRLEDTTDDRQPVVQIYRNVTLAGVPRNTALLLKDDGPCSRTEINFRLRRNVFGMPAGASMDARPVLVFTDLCLVNSPPGPPSTWPLGLLDFAQYYVGLNRSQATGVQIIAVRSVRVLTPGQFSYINYWRTRSVSLSTDERKASAWLTRIASFPNQIANDDSSGSSTCTTVASILLSCNSSMTTSATAIMSPGDFDLWSFEPSLDGSVQTPLQPGSFATAATANQLLDLLQEAWCCGPRAILVIANITLRPGEWPQAGVVLSYNVSLVGPLAGDPVWLDTGGLPLVRAPAVTDQLDRNVTNQKKAQQQQQQQQQQPPIVLQLHRLRVLGFRPPLLTAERSDVEAAAQRGAFGDQLSLNVWKDRCLQEAPMSAGNASVVRYDLRSCLLELPRGALQLLWIYNSQVECAAYTGTTTGSDVILSDALCDFLASSNTAMSQGLFAAPLLSLLSRMLKMDPPPSFAGGRLSSIFLTNSSPSLLLLNTTLNGGAVSLSRCAFAEVKTDAGLQITFQQQSAATPPPPLGSPVVASSGVPALVGDDRGTGTRSDRNASIDDGIAGAACSTDTFLLALRSSMLNYSNSLAGGHIETPAAASAPTKVSTVVIGVVVGGGICAVAATLALVVYVRVLWRRRRNMGVMLLARSSDRRTSITSKACYGDETVNTAELGHCGETLNNMKEAGTATESIQTTAGGAGDCTFSLSFKGQQGGAAAAAVALTIAHGDLRNPDVWQQHGTMADVLIGIVAPPCTAADGNAPPQIHQPRAIQGFRPMKVGGSPAAQQHGDTSRDVSLQTAGSSQVTLRRHNFHDCVSNEISDLLRHYKKAVALGGSSSGGAKAQQSGSSGTGLLRLLGRGAHGAVYLGSWRGMPSAIKVIILNAADSGERRERLVREAALTAALSHPNVVPTYDYDIRPMLATFGRAVNQMHSEDDDGLNHQEMVAALQVNLSMQYCEGGTLAAALRDGKFAMPVDRTLLAAVNLRSQQDKMCMENTTCGRPAADMEEPKTRLDWTDLRPVANLPLALLAALDVLRGLEYLHGHKVVHGDLTENNVLLKAVTPVLPPQQLPQQASQSQQRPDEQAPCPDCSEQTASVKEEASQQGAAAEMSPDACKIRSASKLDLDLTFVSSGWDLGEQEGAASPADGCRKNPLTLLASNAGESQLEESLPFDGAASLEDLKKEAAQQLREHRLGGWPAAQAAAQQDTFCQAQTDSLSSPEVSPELPHGSECVSFYQRASAANGALQMLVAEVQRAQQEDQAAAQPLQEVVTISEATEAADEKFAHELVKQGSRLSSALPADDQQQSSSRAPSSSEINSNKKIRACQAATVQQLHSSSQPATGHEENTSGNDQQELCSTSSSSAAAGGGSHVGMMSKLLKWSFKISDFGLSVQLHGGSHSHMSNMAQGTPFFAAPEVVHRGHLSTAADIYSYGVLLWLLLHGVSLMQLRHLLPRVPHVPINNLLLRRCSKLLPPEAHKVLKACLAAEPGGRPLVKDVIMQVEDILRAVAGPELSRLLLSVERTEYLLGDIGSVH